jgi:hypothetical protein
MDGGRDRWDGIGSERNRRSFIYSFRKCEAAEERGGWKKKKICVMNKQAGGLHCEERSWW